MISQTILGDCRQIMPTYPDKHFDIAICDPPYFAGVAKAGYFGKIQSSVGVKRGNFECGDEWDNNIPDQAWMEEVVRISKHQIIFGINYFPFIHCPGRIIWDKVNGKSDFSDCEIASCTFHDTVRLFKYMWNGMCQAKSLREPTTMQGNKKLNEKRINVTQKPVNLYKWLLDKYGVPGQLILDTHLGSGSSRIAADDLGFNFIGIEINEKSYYKQEIRYNQYKLQQKLVLI